MQQFKNMIQKLIIYLALFFAVVTANAEQTRFVMSAPTAVEMGKQFRLSFTLNEQGRNLKLPPGIENNFDILMGPSTGQSISMTSINGKTTQEVTYSFTYILRAKKEGTFELRPASIEVGGKVFESNSMKIQVVQAQSKPAQPQSGTGGETQQEAMQNVDSPSPKTEYSANCPAIKLKFFCLHSSLN